MQDEAAVLAVAGAVDGSLVVANWIQSAGFVVHLYNQGETMRKIARIIRSGAMLCSALIGLSLEIGSAEAEEAFKSELDALRQSLSKYQDVYTAVREGYFSTVGCVHYSGEKMEGHVEYAKGAMGIHFINTSLIGPNPDPLRPPILVYSTSHPRSEGISSRARD